jgi:hypothetical protein
MGLMGWKYYVARMKAVFLRTNVRYDMMVLAVRSDELSSWNQ